MQPNEITVVARNIDNTADVTTALSRHREFSPTTKTNGSSLYISGVHTESAPDKVQLYVSDPKPSGAFLGQQKAELKATRGIVVKDNAGNDVIRNAIINVNVSLPVGISLIDEHNLRAMVAKLLTTTPLITDLTLKLRY